ncbi:MAG TPA: NADP-dependent phosphogluconate dehydrogenase [bacterium]|nr:NADP-dependent phosphogluconate dehydrogenase [bacterium]
MDARECEVGVVGLGVMGRNLLLNMADHGIPVAGYDKDPAQGEALRREAADRSVAATATVEEFTSMLRPPRAALLLVPAGPPVDAVIRALLPSLAAGDLIVDGGNSLFKDTDLRGRALAARRIAFLGMGISGGEEGARHGPSLMPGGSPEAYARIRPVVEAIAARVDGEPCVTYLGPGSAGHYVKMVHNGIEYGLMQLIAESYDLMKRGLGLSDDELCEVYEGWGRSELAGFLIEITAQIFRRVDDRTGKRLVDVILDEAKQKGTGMWTSQNAMELGTPVPTIDAAVSARALSGLEPERVEAARTLAGPAAAGLGERAEMLASLRHALYAGMIITFAQGMALLRQASGAYGYHLALGEVATIWRGGCIIRAALLEKIRAAYRARPDLPNLLVDPALAREVIMRQRDLRTIVCRGAGAGIPLPGLAASLAYFDGYRSAWLPANLIQAQRDFFGAHTYERADAPGVFHTEWRHD